MYSRSSEHGSLMSRASATSHDDESNKMLIEKIRMVYRRGRFGHTQRKLG